MKFKKLLIAVAVLATCPMLALAFVIPSSHTFTASVTPTGGVQSWSAVIKNASNNSSVGVTQVSWSGVSAGQAGYKVADQYIDISVNITNIVNWRMTVYTNNANFTGNKSSNTTTGFGLVGQSNSSQGLPLAWKVLDSTQAVSAPVFVVKRGDNTSGFSDYMWKFMQDKNLRNAANTASVFDPTSTYVRVWDNTGFYWSEDPSKAGASNDNDIVLYLASDFTHSLAQTYLTNSLTLDVTAL